MASKIEKEMKKIHTVILFCALGMLITGCKVRKKEISEYYSYETECVQNLHNGVQRIRAWGTGDDTKEALLNAQKQALRDFLFVGIRKGKDGCSFAPFVVNMEKQRNASAYIKQLFDTKEYKNYMEVVGKKYRSIRNKHNTRAEVVVDIDTNKLREGLFNKVK